ncbi:MAG TPA: choice-of-anchor Q domain-containing protein [Kofleriaceae bacterium]
MTGADTGNCTRAQPCATATYAVGRLAATRTHLVFAAGTYAHCFEIGHDDTNAPSVEIHGGGATFASDCNDGAELLLADVPVIIHDATFDGNSTQSNAIQCGAAHCEAYRLQFAQAGSFSVGAETVLHDVQFANSFTSAIYLQSGSHLTADRVQIAGGDEGIVAGNTGTSSVDISNLLVYGTSGIALDIVFAQGMIRASTIADNGLHMNQAPYSLKCGSNLTVESSILWNRLGNYAPISGTCAFVETIAGPSYDSSSTLDEDPTFVAPVSYDYHLQAGSPAIDQVTIGPDTDLDGVARPQGASYDIGAYEYKP